MTHKIGIDARMIQNTGIGTYLTGLLEGFSELEDEERKAILLFGCRKALASSAFPTQTFRERIYSLREQAVYPLMVHQCSLWHAPHYNVPYFKGRTKLVVTIHDLIHWIFRHDFFTPLQSFYAEKMLTRAVHSSDHIITVSHKTKDDLISYFDADPDKISVTYEGVSSAFKKIADVQVIRAVLKKYKIPEDYFLYVGMIKPHKNVLWLTHLFHKLKSQDRVHSVLVLIGKKDPRYPKGFGSLSHLESKGEVIHIPFVPLEDLVALYNGATALIHPSLYEGFGLTLLEAMACETPVIACRSASIPEVAGDAALLVESCSEHEMMDAIVRMEKFPAMRDQYAAKGCAHVRKFSWKTMADETLEIYERVLGQ